MCASFLLADEEGRQRRRRRRRREPGEEEEGRRGEEKAVRQNSLPLPPLSTATCDGEAIHSHTPGYKRPKALRAKCHRA